MSGIKRLNNIDLLKGIGILLVILGHLKISDGLHTVIYMVHMPLFFFISGFLWKKKEVRYSLREFLQKQTRSLLQPYMIFGSISICYTLGKMLLRGGIEWQKVFINIYSFLFGVRSIVPFDNKSYLGLLWFLPALFVGECIYYFWKRFVARYVMAFVTFMTSLGVLYSGFIGERFRLPFCMDTAMLCLIFLGLGDFVSEKQIIVRKRSTKILLVIVCVLVCFVSYYQKYDIDLIRLKIECPIIFYCFSAFFCYVIFEISINRKNGLLQFIGKHSLYYMLLQEYAVDIYKAITKIIEVFTKVEIETSLLMPWMSITVITTILVIIVNRFFPFLVEGVRISHRKS